MALAIMYVIMLAFEQASGLHDHTLLVVACGVSSDITGKVKRTTAFRTCQVNHNNACIVFVNMCVQMIPVGVSCQ